MRFKLLGHDLTHENDVEISKQNIANKVFFPCGCLTMRWLDDTESLSLRYNVY